MSTTTWVALSLMALAILTMPIYAVIARRRPVDADVARRPTTIILGTWVRDWLMWMIGPVERKFVQWKLSPDIFNYIGGAFGLFSGFAYANNELALGGWLILLGGLSDIFDGRIARARGIGSNYGEFLDSMLDRFAEMFVFIGIALYFEPTWWAMTATVLASGGSMMVSYARAKGEAVGVDCRGGIMQRAERLVVLCDDGARMGSRGDSARGRYGHWYRLAGDGGVSDGLHLQGVAADGEGGGGEGGE
jgi:phosphatidylglycerophosphate synthase